MGRDILSRVNPHGSEFQNFVNAHPLLLKQHRAGGLHFNRNCRISSTGDSLTIPSADRTIPIKRLPKHLYMILLRLSLLFQLSLDRAVLCAKRKQNQSRRNRSLVYTLSATSSKQLSYRLAMIALDWVLNCSRSLITQFP